MTVSVRLGSETSQLPTVFASNEHFGLDADLGFTLGTADGSTVAEMAFPGTGGIVMRPDLLPARQPGSFWQCEKMVLPLAEARDGRQPGPLQPGKYMLTAKLWWSPGRGPGMFVDSNALAVEITQAAGRDAEAVKVLRAPVLAAFFTGRLGGKPDAVAELLDKYPDSTYSQYARLQLLLERMRWFWNTKRSGLSASERQELQSMVSQAQEQVRGDPRGLLSDNILLYRARMQMLLREKKAAAQTLLGLVREYPKGDAAEAALAWLEKIPEEMKQALSKAAPVPEKPSTKATVSPKAPSTDIPK